MNIETPKEELHTQMKIMFEQGNFVDIIEEISQKNPGKGTSNDYKL